MLGLGGEKRLARVDFRCLSGRPKETLLPEQVHKRQRGETASQLPKEFATMLTTGSRIGNQTLDFERHFAEASLQPAGSKLAPGPPRVDEQHAALRDHVWSRLVWIYELV